MGTDEEIIGLFRVLSDEGKKEFICLLRALTEEAEQETASEPETDGTGGS